MKAVEMPLKMYLDETPTITVNASQRSLPANAQTGVRWAFTQTRTERATDTNHRSAECK